LLTHNNYKTSYVVMRTQYLKELPADWRPAAGIFAALGDETRQKILLIFEPKEELSIKEIAQMFPLGRTTVTHHLGVLEKAGILSVRREGRLALYKLVYAPVLDALKRLRQLIANDLETANSQRRRIQAKVQKQAKKKANAPGKPAAPQGMKHSKKTGKATTGRG